MIETTALREALNGKMTQYYFGDHEVSILIEEQKRQEIKVTLCLKKICPGPCSVVLGDQRWIDEILVRNLTVFSDI
jgi:hypothetical protein